MDKLKKLRVLGFKVTDVTVIQGGGTDSIVLGIDGPTTFPACGYPLTMRFEAQGGTGPTWVKEQLGVEPTIVRRPG